MFEGYPKEILIKDGSAIIIRPVVKEDEERLKAFFAQIPPEERWFLRDDISDPQVMHDWISHLDYTRVIPLVAVRQEDNRIIANLRLHRRPAECLSHIAHLRIMVDPEFRNLRLGTWMLLDAIKFAMDLGIEKLVAEFVSSVEDAAMHAADRLDFFQQAVLKDYVRDPKCGYRDLVIMVKTLHKEWCDF